MTDHVEVFGESVIHHGKNNDRAYLMKVNVNDCPELVDYAIRLSETNGYSKIFAKAPESSCHPFLQNGFTEEAKVPKLFNGEEDGCFYSQFIHPERRQEKKPEMVEKILETAISKFVEVAPLPVLGTELHWDIMQKSDVQTMSMLYKRVFETYPFPVDDPAYLANCMDEDVIYHGIWNEDELIALSSAEMDCVGENVEMTDFATRPDFRARGLATYLLDKMEEDVRSRGVRTSYTIARAYSFGMNITFAKHGYSFAGTLTNNTQISGQLESMNIWYKPL
ncbi:MAG: putative beta-lysine N-acetyltransferase [Desulfuromonadales bacterium]